MPGRLRGDGGRGGAPFLRLRARQLRADLDYWGRVLGLTGQEGELAGGFQRVYRWYILLFLAGWVVLAWEALLDAARTAHQEMPAALAPLLGLALPPLIGLGLVVLVGRALLESPFQMSAADEAFLVGSPLPKRGWILVDFARAVLPWLAASLPLGAALAVLLSGRTGDAWPGSLAGLLLVLAAQALAWAAGLARLASPRRLVRAALWLLPAGLLAATYAPGAPARLPGEAFLDAVGAGGAAGGTGPGLLAILAGALLVLLVLVAGAVDLPLAIEASAARIELGDLAALRWLDPGLARRLRRRLALRSARRRGQLPARCGWWALPARVAVGFLRQPGRIGGLLGTGLALLAAVGLVMHPQVGGAWFAWLLFWLARPPRSLVEWVEEAGQEPFLRRLVPWGALPLLAGEALVPAAALAVPGAPLALYLGAGSGAAGAAVALLLYWALLALAALTQGLAVLGAEIGGAMGRGSADLLLGLVGFGTVLLAGAQGGSPVAALVAALFFDAVLAWSWGRPRRPAPAAGEEPEGA
ncbi:MAG: hypothetical protein QJR14_08370 [Bacillota bacterium]|nr:hypothetical protein [Bacillota bacterium]